MCLFGWVSFRYPSQNFGLTKTESNAISEKTLRKESDHGGKNPAVSTVASLFVYLSGFKTGKKIELRMVDGSGKHTLGSEFAILEVEVKTGAE